jgi:site-specific recombinase XerD
LHGAVVVPAMIADASDRAARRFLEFFAANIRNKNTPYLYQAACTFFGWLEQNWIGDLADIEPLHVALYRGAAGDAAKPTVKQHLAAIRMLFDWLVVGEVLAVNPAHAVRGPKHAVKRRKTPVLAEEQLAIRSTGSTRRPWSGCATHALIGVMTYSFARIGAVVAMRVEDYFPSGKRW